MEQIDHPTTDHPLKAMTQHTPTAKRRVTFLVNPRAGHQSSRRRARYWDHLQALASRHSPDHVSVHFCDSLPTLCQLAERDAQDSDRVVVAVGGDGTLHAVANALVNQPAALGVLPAGSGNDFASLLPPCPDPKTDSPEALLQHFLTAPVGWSDVARVVMEGQTGRQQRYMINGLGIGIEGAVAQTVQRLTRLSGFSRYLMAALWQLASYRPCAMTLATDGVTVMADQPTLLVNIGNGRRAGGGFLFHPTAKLDDGYLDLCWVRAIPRWQQAIILPTVLWGAHRRFRVVHHAEAKTLRIDSPQPMALHIDGESMAERAHTIEVFVCAKALRVLGLPDLDSNQTS